VAFSPDGRLAAAEGTDEHVIRVWDVPSGREVAVLEVAGMPNRWDLQFTSDGHLLSATTTGLLRWELKSGLHEVLYRGNISRYSATPDGRRVLMVENEGESRYVGRAVLLDLDSSSSTRLDRFGTDVTVVALDPTGAIAVTGHADGDVRIGKIGDEEPHLLLGHGLRVDALAIDPLGRWIASGGQDKTVRLWPMPDLSKPPLHTLPHDELIAKLKTLTNLRVVRDPDSSTGWTLTHDPFPGWADVPEW
jgi:WD40 repeat protein